MNTPKRFRSNSTPEEVSAVKMGSNEEGANVGQLTVEEFKNILDNKLAGVNAKLTVIEDLIAENKVLKKELLRQNMRADKLEERLEALESRARRSNLIFSGVDCGTSADLSACIKNICSNKLEIYEDVGISQCYKIGRRQQAPSKSLILVEFTSAAHADIVINRSKKLKGSNIYVQRDTTKTIREKRSKLLQIKKEILRLKPGERILVVEDRMYIQKMLFRWDNNLGLIRGTDKECGLEEIKKRFSVDLSKFINNLARQNYKDDQQHRED